MMFISHQQASKQQSERGIDRCHHLRTASAKTATIAQNYERAMRKLKKLLLAQTICDVKVIIG